jgi:hypothetical protein
MALAGSLAGYCSMFYVVPLLGAVAVFATYQIGRAVGDPLAGVLGAWLLATSPIFLFFLMVPMTDVAVTGTWAAAIALAFRGTTSMAMLSGALAGLSIAIRPNLFFVAAILGAFIARPGAADRRVRSTLGFVLMTAPGIVLVARVNQYLFGSPLMSGYGRLEDQLALANVAANAPKYLRWFVESQTVLGIAGLAAVLVPLRVWWGRADARNAAICMGLIVVAVWGHYFLYTSFDNWIFLRFLLPTFPVILIGGGRLASMLMRGARAPAALAAIGVVLLVGLRGLDPPPARDGFRLWLGDRDVAALASALGPHLPENSVFLADHHSGVIRYYAGRRTLRYPYLDPKDLDAAVAWHAQRGVRLFAVLEPWEVDPFRQQFAGQQAVRALETPMWSFKRDIEIMVFDLTNGATAAPPPPFVDGTELRCAPPAPQAQLERARTAERQ